MPKEVTHWIISLEGLSHVDVVNKHIHSFLLGAVIHDGVYYTWRGEVLPGMEEAEKELHGVRGEDTYAPLRRVLLTLPDPIPEEAKAFLLGVQSHIIVDSTFHPFIYYFAGIDPKEAKIRHKILEAYLDLHLMDRLKLPNKGLINQSLRCLQPWEETLFPLLKPFFNHPNKKGDRLLRKMLSSMAMLQPLLFFPPVGWILRKLPLSKTKSLGSAFYPTSKPLRCPFFDSPFRYHHPVTGKAQMTSMEQLLREAKEKILASWQIWETHALKEKLYQFYEKAYGPSLTTGMVKIPHDQMHYQAEGFAIPQDLFKPKDKR